MESYAAQYEARYVSRDKKIESIDVRNIIVLEDHVIQIDFTVIPKKLSDDVLASWQGTNQNSLISCQWVLWLSETVTSEGKRVYQVTKVERPAAYDLAKYQTSGQKDKDEANMESYGELPFEEKDYTYRIQDGRCSVSYDGGKSFKKVPVDVKVLATVGDGKSYYNKLQEGNYSISQVKTAFVYGGTSKNPLFITFSNDLGKTFVTKIIPNRLEAIRVKFINFITKDLGYVIVAGDRTMNQEIQIILKTQDGGETWKETGEGPSSWLLQSGGFLEENLGFFSYPKVEGMEPIYIGQLMVEKALSRLFWVSIQKNS